MYSTGFETKSMHITVITTTMTTAAFITVPPAIKASIPILTTALNHAPAANKRVNTIDVNVNQGRYNPCKLGQSVAIASEKIPSISSAQDMNGVSVLMASSNINRVGSFKIIRSSSGSDSQCVATL